MSRFAKPHYDALQARMVQEQELPDPNHEKAEYSKSIYLKRKCSQCGFTGFMDKDSGLCFDCSKAQAELRRICKMCSKPFYTKRVNQVTCRYPETRCGYEYAKKMAGENQKQIRELVRSL